MECYPRIRRAASLAFAAQAIQGPWPRLLLQAEEAFRVVGVQEVVVKDDVLDRPGVHEQDSYSPREPSN